LLFPIARPAVLQIEKYSFKIVDMLKGACQHQLTNTLGLSMSAEHGIARPRFVCGASGATPSRRGRRSRLHDSSYAREFAGILQMRGNFAADVLARSRECLPTGMIASKLCSARN
jgi:hypothetical protein